jgi:hypothetical protein
MTKERKAFIARYPSVKAVTKDNEKDVTEDFLSYLIEENIASGCDEAEKAEIANAVANEIGDRDLIEYKEGYQDSRRTQISLTI